MITTFRICLCLLMVSCAWWAADTAALAYDDQTPNPQGIEQNNKSGAAAKIAKQTDPSKESVFFYPDTRLLEKLKTTSSDIVRNRSKYMNNRVHLEWMHHVRDVLPDIDPNIEKLIIQAHTSLLFLKDRLDHDYYSGNINKQEFSARLAGLMQWFQEVHRSFLNDKEFNNLFAKSSPEEEATLAPASDGGPDFPIYNPQTSAEMIKKNFDDETIRNMNRFYQVQSQELKDIREIYESGSYPEVDKSQVKNDMLRIEKQLKSAFMRHCRKILTDEQFKMIFNSQAAE